jgi:hypothetical protein
MIGAVVMVDINCTIVGPQSNKGEKSVGMKKWWYMMIKFKTTMLSEVI